MLATRFMPENYRLASAGGFLCLMSFLSDSLMTVCFLILAHTLNEIYLSKALEKLGANAMTKDQELDIGAAFIKFSIVTKELSALMKTLVSNPTEVLLPEQWG